MDFNVGLKFDYDLAFHEACSIYRVHSLLIPYSERNDCVETCRLQGNETDVC